jgi:hypothetical protein
MAINKFIDYKSGLQITKISEPLAPIEANYLDDNGRLKLKDTSYYFDGTKRMQFSANRVLSGEFTFGIAFAPTTQFSLGKFILNESTDGYLGFGKTETKDGIINIKLDGKVAKNATLNAETESGTTKYRGLNFYENKLNVIFIQRSITNQITVRGMSGERLLVINADTNTAGNITLNRLGGNTLEGFEGYIAEIFIEQRVLSQIELKGIGKFWFEKYM